MKRTVNAGIIKNDSNSLLNLDFSVVSPQKSKGN